MTALARRELLALTAAGVPLAALGSTLFASGANATTTPTALLHDATLPDARRFAARAAQLGQTSQALAGDPVRQAQALFARRPQVVFGVSRASDRLLFAEVAREAGYEELVQIAQRAGCIHESRCRSGAEAFAALARASGPNWPRAFAELALGAAPLTDALEIQGADAPTSFSWVLRRKG
ncbi:hypothetical protein [Novosphingobium sp. MBES04]|uniref:hypothetical protein n=1 Tax=Novosphingobium sp. MBES04 TaxID=1206458 RepID=UPI00069504BE|nr:hypothetical protein [Novosphingobium sp. MBES04]GAM05508.1 hypothetical conserved protein [Novosphingobium sp. MBES04]